MLHCSAMLLWSLTIVFAAKSHLEMLYDKLRVADEKHNIEIDDFLRSSFTVYKFYSNFFDQHAFYFYDQITQSNFYTDNIFTTIKFNSHWRTYVIGHDEDGMREQLIQALHQKVMTDTPYLEIEDIHRFVIQEHDTKVLAEECALLERNIDSFFTDTVAQELQTLARTDCVTITINCKVTKDNFCLIKNILSHINEKGETGMYIANQIYIDIRNSKDLECYLKRLQNQLDSVKQQEMLFNSRLMHYTANIISKQLESESVNSIEFKLESDHAKKHYNITGKCSYNIYKSNMTQQRRGLSDFDRDSSVTTSMQNNLAMPKITANFAYLLSLYNFDGVNHFKVTINVAAKVPGTFTFNFLELISNSNESRSKVFVQGTYTEAKLHKDLGVSDITDKIASNTFKNTCLYFLYDLDLLKLKQKNMLTTDYLVKNELPNRFLYFNSFHKKFESQLSLESLSSSVKKYIYDSDTRYKVTDFVHDYKYTYQTDTQVQSNFTHFQNAKEFLNLRSYGSTPLLDIILYEHKNHEQDKVKYPRLAHNDAIFYNKNNAIYIKEDFGSYGAIYHIIYENRNNANKHWLNFYDINLFFLLYNNQTLRNELALCMGNIQNLEYIDVLSFYFEIIANIQFIYEQKPFAEFLMTKIDHVNKLCLVKAYKICKSNHTLSTSTINSYVRSLTIAKYLKDKFVIFINHIDQYFLQHNNSYKYAIRSYSVGNIEYETLMCASNNIKAHIESETRS